jgi:hypothetical protein
MAVHLGCCSMHAAATAFRYQGALNEEGQAAEGVFDFRFTLHSTESDASQLGNSFLVLAAPITNGLFALDVDFGEGLFNGETRWLQIEVRQNDATNEFVPLMPRQPVRATPYPLFALESATTAMAEFAQESPWEGLTNVPEGFADGIDNDTLYDSGTGLELLENLFNVRFDGSGVADTVARSDHFHLLGQLLFPDIQYDASPEKREEPPDGERRKFSN